ncbi:MAG: hypothetical protein JXD21_03995 [Candidatus Omnitrophica bacterium]|nr:hypothetical protein [Candidatus Omnitrophota bacterium]
MYKTILISIFILTCPAGGVFGQFGEDGYISDIEQYRVNQYDIGSRNSLPSEVIDDLYEQSDLFSSDVNTAVPSISTPVASNRRDNISYPLNPPDAAYSSGITETNYPPIYPSVRYLYNPNYVGTLGVNMFEPQAVANPYAQSSSTVPAGAYATVQPLTHP